MEPLLYLGGLAMAPLAILALLVFVKRPDWAPATILLAATATPWSFAKGVTPVLVITAAVAAITLLACVVTGWHRRLEFARPRRAALAFAIAAIVSAVWGWFAMEPEVKAFWTQPFLPVQLGQLSALVLAPAALLLTSSLLTRRSLLVWA